ncbi:HEPACAM family member 2-like isoform X2 [Neoarius graeffei]|uniref:HEPACAM family member 2-like isoform X2 n=1 Tax=Neoarius graeffei TaxID=443677 RepID=UPI00298C3C99|nr:HEPACAM family member 2-like isoform X2 [Neoarius graeffei]
MPAGDFFIVVLLWMFVGRGVDGERVTGVLHGQVELRGRYGHHSDVCTVEWNKYSAKNSTKKLLYLFQKPNNTTCPDPCQNINFNSENRSLILVHLTPEDEGIYEEKSTFTNSTIKYFNITLTFLTATNITVSSSPGSLTLTCGIKGEFQLLQWFRNGLPLPEDQGFSFSENKTTMRVSHPNSSDCGTYTCRVSNENGKSEVQVSINGNSTGFPCKDSGTSPRVSVLERILVPVGSLLGLLFLCIILICICKYYGHRKIKTTSTEEPIYDEPTQLQEEAATPTMDPLVVVYQDFIKPKDSHQSEDFGYSTIADVLENTQHSNTT